MSAGQCLPINSAPCSPTPKAKATASTIVSCFLTLLFLLNAVGWSSGLQLTHLNAPLVADLREKMELDCHFDMGVEELYAVKWYKDDHEFFRYMPGHLPGTMSFPVAGVHLVPSSTNCSNVHCKVRLRDLTRDHSGGAYRCEISSEAPAFRLAARTHNVTVAALPRQNPRIEGLTTSYTEGDTVEAKCVSDPADPAPILSWYINENEAPSKFVGDMTSSDGTTTDNVASLSSTGLVSRSLTLRFVAERKHSRGDSIELRCMSSLPGIPLLPQVTTLKIPLRQPHTQVINNEKLHWFNSPSSMAVTIHGNVRAAWIIMIVSGVRWGALHGFQHGIG